jgi:hypothetical protein
MEADLKPKPSGYPQYHWKRFQQLGGGRKDGSNKASFNAEERSHHLASHDHKYGLIDVCNWIVSKK